MPQSRYQGREPHTHPSPQTTVRRQRYQSVDAHPLTETEQKRPGQHTLSRPGLSLTHKASWGCYLWCPRRVQAFRPGGCQRHFEMLRAGHDLFPPCRLIQPSSNFWSHILWRKKLCESGSSQSFLAQSTPSVIIRTAVDTLSCRCSLLCCCHWCTPKDAARTSTSMQSETFFMTISYQWSGNATRHTSTNIPKSELNKLLPIHL